MAKVFCGECMSCKRLLKAAEDGQYACVDCHAVYPLRCPDGPDCSEKHSCLYCDADVRLAVDVLNLNEVRV